ncbi:hypothetical protein [Achromobacter sp. 413638]
MQPTARPACPCCRRHMPSLSDDAGLCERCDEVRAPAGKTLA